MMNAKRKIGEHPRSRGRHRHQLSCNLCDEVYFDLTPFSRYCDFCRENNELLRFYDRMTNAS